MRRAWSTLRNVNPLAVIAVLAFLVLPLASAYYAFGRAGGNFLATNVFAAILGAAAGLAWPRIKQSVIRANSPIEAGEYLTIGGRLYPLMIVDGPATYQPPELVLGVSGELALPDVLERAHRHMVKRMTTYTGAQVLFDGACFVLASPPLIRRNWDAARERPTVVADLRQTSYFIRVLCRGAMTKELEEHLAVDWPSDVPALGELRRQIVSDTDGFSPFLHPGAGINVCLVALDRMGRPWTIVQRRGSAVAEQTGTWATSIHESFAPSDVTAENTIDPYATASRGAREELGVSLSKVEYFVVAMDEGSLPGEPVRRSGGFELIGCAETSLPAERLGDTRFRGRDKFEVAELIALQLSEDAVLSLLVKAPPELWFPPALLSLLETLERYRPGSWHRVAAVIEARSERQSKK